MLLVAVVVAAAFVGWRMRSKAKKKDDDIYPLW